MGIDKYNEECRKIVMRYSSEWRNTVERIGRWIDFDNDYKTLNITFMESVWWAFSELFKRNLVYRGLRVMPYSTGCTTPLSNFEAGLAYRDVNDPASRFSNVTLLFVTDFSQLLSHFLSLTIPPHLYWHGQLHRGHYLRISVSVFTQILPTSKFMTRSEAEISLSTRTSLELCIRNPGRRNIRKLVNFWAPT